MKGKQRGIMFSVLLVAVLALTILPVNMVFASSSGASGPLVGGVNTSADVVSGYVAGTIASIPVSTGATDEYNLFLNINGQDIWIAATTIDFPNLFNVGATLTGILSFSNGWWTLTKADVVLPAPLVPSRLVGRVLTTPVPTGTPDEYSMVLLINDQEVTVAASTTDFPQLPAVGAVLGGYLNYSSGWAVFTKEYVATPATPVPGSVVGIVSSASSTTGATAEYDLFLTINGQQVWVAATTTDFPNLFSVGATLIGILDYSNGWWTFTKA